MGLQPHGVETELQLSQQRRPVGRILHLDQVHLPIEVKLGWWWRGVICESHLQFEELSRGELLTNHPQWRLGSGMHRTTEAMNEPREALDDDVLELCVPLRELREK